MRGGAFATVQATPAAPVKPWACQPVPNFYPLCATAAAGRCSPLTCAQQAAAGQCGAPFMRVVDARTRTIVQYCSTACGCSADPAALASRAAPAAGEPEVRRFDGATAEAAANAAASAAFGAATRGYSGDAACCASAPRFTRRDMPAADDAASP